MKINRKADPLPSFANFNKILVEDGREAYVAKLIEVYGRHIRRGGSNGELVFRQVLVGYIGFKDENLYEIYGKEMLKLMPEETQKVVQKNLAGEFQRTRPRRGSNPSPSAYVPAKGERQEKQSGLLRGKWQELFGKKPAK